MARSATSSVSTSGVLVTAILRALAASTSTVSYPTPKCAMVLSLGSRAIVAPSMPPELELATAVMPAMEAINASLSGALHSRCVS